MAEKYSLRLLNDEAVAFFFDFYKQYYEKEVLLAINTVQEMKAFIEYRCWVDTQNVFALENVPDHLKLMHKEFMKVEKTMSIHHINWSIKVSQFMREGSFRYLFSIKM